MTCAAVEKRIDVASCGSGSSRNMTVCITERWRTESLILRKLSFNVDEGVLVLARLGLTVASIVGKMSQSADARTATVVLTLGYETPTVYALSLPSFPQSTAASCQLGSISITIIITYIWIRRQ